MVASCASECPVCDLVAGAAVWLFLGWLVWAWLSDAWRERRLRRAMNKAKGK